MSVNDGNKIKFSGEIWQYPGKGAWHFITIPKKYYDDINLFDYKKQAWGSLKVKVDINNYEWDTSIFPDKKTSTYQLPIKKDIRKILNLVEGDTVKVILNIV